MEKNNQELNNILDKTQTLDELLDSKDFKNFMDSCDFVDENNDDYDTLEDTGRYPN